MSNDNSELAKGAGLAAEKALDFVEKLIAGPFIEGTGIFTDKIKYWRFKNQVNIITKAKKYLESKGISTPKKIPIKDVTTLLEYASFEEESIMQDSWAKLLSNTINPNNKFDSCHVFSQILNQLSINEILVLNHMYVNSFMLSSGHRPYFDASDLKRKSQTDYISSSIILDNIIRLRLVEEQPPKLLEEIKKISDSDYIEQEDIDHRIENSNRFRLSNFGVELMKQITD
ncbi:Abi-alpha family protein [Winogradskyella sp. 3972H.M.0a.05]|uniref:Abi-alpha family protein n=1 Tax=Winogradskyella sp. 3972H.M.0a.05 TaxID=2950277 RepID=UPI003399AE11